MHTYSDQSPRLRYIPEVVACILVGEVRTAGVPGHGWPLGVAGEDCPTGEPPLAQDAMLTKD